MALGLKAREGAVPVPLRFTLCGLPLALSVMTRVADRVPTPPGANRTGIVVLAPAATVMGTGPTEKLNSPALDPVNARSEIISEAVPVLVTLIFCAAVVVA